MQLEIDVENGEASAVRTLGRSGNSTVVRFPPQLLKLADFEEGDVVEITAHVEGTIRIEKASGGNTDK